MIFQGFVLFWYGCYSTVSMSVVYVFFQHLPATSVKLMYQLQAHLKIEVLYLEEVLRGRSGYFSKRSTIVQ